MNNRPNKTYFTVLLVCLIWCVGMLPANGQERRTNDSRAAREKAKREEQKRPERFLPVVIEYNTSDVERWVRMYALVSLASRQVQNGEESSTANDVAAILQSFLAGGAGQSDLPPFFEGEGRGQHFGEFRRMANSFINVREEGGSGAVELDSLASLLQLLTGSRQGAAPTFSTPEGE